MTTIQEKNFNSQPFFLVDDAAYGRMLTKLRAGEPFVKTYFGTCPHKNKECKCPYFKNVLEDGCHIVREFGGKRKQVYSITEFKRELKRSVEGE